MSCPKCTCSDCQLVEVRRLEALAAAAHTKAQQAAGAVTRAAASVDAAVSKLEAAKAHAASTKASAATAAAVASEAVMEWRKVATPTKVDPAHKARIDTLRRAVTAAHPDMGGNNDAFIAAKAALDAARA